MSSVLERRMSDGCYVADGGNGDENEERKRIGGELGWSKPSVRRYICLTDEAALRRNLAEI